MSKHSGTTKISRAHTIPKPFNKLYDDLFFLEGVKTIKLGAWFRAKGGGGGLCARVKNYCESEHNLKIESKGRGFIVPMEVYIKEGFENQVREFVNTYDFRN